MIGEQIGRYEILDVLGEGGMGKVFRARHTESGEPAAVKILLPKFSKVESIVRRFFNEAKAAGATHHPGIIDVFESGFCGDRAFMALELVEGEALSDLIEREKFLPSGEVIALGVQIALALAAAHANGIIHRDLKPDNIMLVADAQEPTGRRVKILDFGLAKLLDDLGQATVRTNTGVTMGTPSYMAPEQWQADRNIDHRADIYGLGCVLFHLTCGRPPFVHAGFAAKMRAHLKDPAPDPRTLITGVPDALADLILVLLAKDPRERYRTMADVAAALNAIERGATVPPGGMRAMTADIRPNSKRPNSKRPNSKRPGSKRAEPEPHEPEPPPAHSLHPSMPSVPQLPPERTTKLPLLLLALLAVGIGGAIVAWRVFLG